MSGLNHAEMSRSLKYRVCLRHPAGHLEIQFDQAAGQYVPWCVACNREGFSGPALGRDNLLAEKEWNNMTDQMEKYQGAPVLTQLNSASIKKWLAPEADDVTIEIFLRYCLAMGANPFAREVYLVPFESRTTHKITWTIMPGLQLYLKHASHNPQYQTYQAGLVVQRGDAYVDIMGTLTYPGDQVLGAWCRVYKRGAPVPFEHRIKMEDWNKHREVWLTNPNSMIEVRAISQALRRAFPDQFAPTDDPDTYAGMPVIVADETTAKELVPPAAAGIAAPALAAREDTPPNGEGTPQDSGGAPQETEPPDLTWNEFWGEMKRLGKEATEVRAICNNVQSMKEWLTQGHTLREAVRLVQLSVVQQQKGKPS